MRIEHVALWTGDLERMKSFYGTYFGAVAGPKYSNPRSGFVSYFLSFASGARLELMHMPGVNRVAGQADQQWLGYAHLAVAVGSEAEVDALTERLRGDGFAVLGEPRRTGDGYSESVVLDPDGNRIEITV
ncbi:MAG TPA: VOC family protein [Ardenticatenaceae bacterium]|nr:VOC family protein [Ardenticatenaceae bacterium]